MESWSGDLLCYSTTEQLLSWRRQTVDDFFFHCSYIAIGHSDLNCMISATTRWQGMERFG